MDLTTKASEFPLSSNDTLFAGGGQMGEMIRRYDWDSHPLGNPRGWPLSLKTGIRIMLHSRHPIFIWWTREMYMFHNDAYVPLMGKKHPEGLGAKGYEVWAETWPQLGGVLEGILRGEEAFYGEELEVSMNRQGYMDETYWTFSYSAMPDDEGRVNGIFCACNEVTESVLARRRLQTIKDLSERLVQWPTLEEACQTACQVLERSAADVPFSLLYLPDETGKVAKLATRSGDLPNVDLPATVDLTFEQQGPWPLSKVWQERQPAVVQLALQVPADGLRPERVTVLPIPKPGEPALLALLVTGLSKRLEYDAMYQNFHQMLAGQIATALSSVLARQQAEQQRARLHALFMEAPAPICILDGQELVFELVNPAYQQLFPGRSLRGKPLLEALPELTGGAAWHSLQQVLRTGHTHEEKEILIPVARYQDTPLEDRYFRYIQQARRNLDGDVDGVVVFAFEISEQVEARRKVEESRQDLQALNEELAAINEELAAANEEIQAANEELSQTNGQLTRVNSDLDNFVYTASHDLKAPIANIEGLLKAMERQLSQEFGQNQTVQQIYGLLYASLNRFKTTIRDLSEVARISKEGQDDVAPMEIGEVLEEVLQDLAPQIHDTRARMEISLNCAPVSFSRKNLKSVLYNLLSNALKYRSPDRAPFVRVSCQEQEGYQVLTVGDNGLGMDMSQKEKIFALFKRLHTHVEGTGIGLYIVKKMIENAGGRVEVESQVGVGSTFRLYFKG